jgi:hypothetical protein
MTGEIAVLFILTFREYRERKDSHIRGTGGGGKKLRAEEEIKGEMERGKKIEEAW